MGPPVPTSRLLRYLVVSVLAFGGASGAAHAQCQYEITAVIAADPCPPPFNNVPQTIGTAFNEAGDTVVGWYKQCGAATGEEAFVWRADTGLVTLPRPAGVSSAQAADISESGVIVGTYLVSGVGFRGFVYENGEYTELPPLPGGAWSGANAISDAGEVVGFRSIGSKGDPVNPFSAFIWSASEGFVDLGVVEGPNSAAVDISSDGVVVGWTGGSLLNSLGFVWDSGNVITLPPIPDGSTSSAAGIDAVRQVCGSGFMDVGDPPTIAARGFFWENGDMTMIAPVSGYDTSGAGDINRVGQVTGLSVKLSNSADRRAFVWQNVTYDLNDLVAPGPALVLRRAKAINDAGQIIADGFDPSFNVVTFVLTPIDRPLGDINIDCHVDEDDLLLLLNDFGQTGSPADINGDGVVNVLDLIDLLLNFGS